MYVIKSNRKTNSYTVRKINRVTQVVRVGRRGLQGDPATNLVQSVNGKQGVVVLNATDVGADPTGSASQALQDAKDYTDTVQNNLDAHEADTANPHSVTKAQVGLGNVDNTSDVNKPVSTATQSALDGKVGKVTTVNTLYGVNGSGNQYSYLISQSSDTSSIAQRSSGGTLTVGTPTASSHATTKAYVDTADALKVNKAGDTMTGALTVSGGSNAFRHVRAGKDIGYGVGAIPDASIYNFTDSKEIFRIFADGSGFIIGGDVGGASTGTNPRYLKGTGFPNGVVSAPVGSTYIDTNATNGAVEWKKATGSGNTGWVVSVGDTGWRNISSLLDADVLASGQIHIRMRGNQIYVNSINAAINSGGSTRRILTDIGSLLGDSYRPFENNTDIVTVVGTPPVITRHMTYQPAPTGGFVYFGSAANGYWASKYAGRGGWPTTLPGTAV